MSFTIFPRHTKYGESSWNRQVVLRKANEIDNNNYSTEDVETALDKRRNMQVTLDSTLYQQLQKESSVQGNKRKDNIKKLKSSLRPVVSEPTSPLHGPTKSVKFDPFYLEKVCVFEGSHSPNLIPRYEENKCPPFKIVYSHWPPIQHTLFQHQQNVQLKRSLKVLDGGSLLHGQVLVRNLGYEKQVEIRYTLDGWQTVENVQAIYQHSRGSLDTFVYDIDIEQGMADRGHIRVTVDMAVRYTVNINHHQETFWDNNDGHNYQIQVVETPIQSLPISSIDKPTIKQQEQQEEQPSDDHHDLLVPPLKLSSTLSTSHRYDFNQSILKAKHNKPSHPSPLSSPPASPTLPSSIIDTNTEKSTPVSSSLNNNNDDKFIPTKKSYSAPSSPSSSPSSLLNPSSLSYSDLVNKYCFYGSNTSTSPSSPALSINS
ncbi:putative phosphatase regulatory subunit-domain-containing protein [Halteromyces radiatus]|uniref:putative phosphatase regulatory subunit-domain-containing protein n=1 Tax=Halteromyces radiatus TaxID=101107 RepID=UPI00222095D8|nr:putative phosphatase regulatory subunit-domain-containing protein [Halteromyces radiatus]KAI8089302.1 putative phosphatase regulatory subunit-domain-containing protein [Halteromyces radiatus]